jgi:hypothetical protein
VQWRQRLWPQGSVVGPPYVPRLSVHNGHAGRLLLQQHNQFVGEAGATNRHSGAGAAGRLGRCVTVFAPPPRAATAAATNRTAPGRCKRCQTWGAPRHFSGMHGRHTRSRLRTQQRCWGPERGEKWSYRRSTQMRSSAAAVSRLQHTTGHRRNLTLLQGKRLRDAHEHAQTWIGHLAPKQLGSLAAWEMQPEPRFSRASILALAVLLLTLPTALGTRED